DVYKRQLQFSPEASVKPQWFTTFEVSVFGGDNHLDLQAIDRPNGAYEWVLCNHVIEHVADDGLALAELLRILAPGGVIELTVPDPFSQRLTEDWGFPREDLHGHYRLYGRDLLERLFRRTGPLPVFPATARDPLTGREDLVLFLAREPQALAPLAALLPRSELALTGL
ncbi:MAG TPA: hypothetical protein DCQ35_14015, partial [Rhodospirillum rubrum]|nr:hypothetical protein [Rhodospirillum rubrum]